MNSLVRRSPVENPKAFFDSYRERVETDFKNARLLIETRLKDLRQMLTLNSEKANALSPLMTLSRGYSIAEYKDKQLKSVGDIEVEDEFTLILADGRLKAVTKSVIKSKKE